MATQSLGRELSNREFFIYRWEQEYPAFVRVFKALPSHHLDYRPHPRSRSAGELVALLVSAQRAALNSARAGRVCTAACAGKNLLLLARCQR